MFTDNTEMKSMDVAIEENDVGIHSIAERNGQINEKFNHLDIAYRNSITKEVQSDNDITNVKVNGNSVLETSKGFYNN